MVVQACRLSSHQAVGLYVSLQRVDAVAEALLHDVHVAAQPASVVGLAHVPAVVVPARSLLGQLLPGLVVTRQHLDLWEGGVITHTHSWTKTNTY